MSEPQDHAADWQRDAYTHPSDDSVNEYQAWLDALLADEPPQKAP